MANQQDSYTVSQGIGTNNRDFPFTFPSFTEGEVKVEIDNVVKTLTTHYTVVNHNATSGGTVRFNATGLPNGTAGTTPVRIFRQTDVDAPKAEFTAGSSLKAGEINDNFKQLRHALQEAIGANATDRKVQEFNIEDGAVTTAKIKADNITSDLIADDQINSEHYAADSIDSEHYAPGSVDTAAIGASQVTTNELATDSVNSSKIIDLNVTRAKLENDAIDSTKLADNAVNSEHYVDGSIDHVHLANDVIDGDNIQDDVVNSEHIAAGALDNEHYAAGSITSDKLSGATVITAAEQGAATTNDTSFLTSAAADARFFNISTGDTIKDGQTFPDNDTTIATTAAINDRIIDLVEEVGGFVPIANETSFPEANPDINNAAGTIVSISALSSSFTTGSGVTTHTFTNGAGSGKNVTVTGLTASTTYPAGFGLLLETTTTSGNGAATPPRAYAFHRLVPKATEVETVANIHGNVTTVAGISSDVTTVAGIHANVTTVAGISGNVTSVANNETNINAVKNNETNINAVKNNETNINTVATANTAVNTVATNIASVNNASANISSINNFGDTYQVAASNPSTDGGGNAVAEGDLYFNTSANRLKVYDGANWVDGVIASGGGAQTTGDTFTGDLKLNDNVNLIIGTGDDLKIFHQSSNGKNYIQGSNTQTILQAKSGESSIVMDPDGGVDLYHNDIKKFETTSAGVTVTGNISLTGNVDGRDLAVDGAKLDNITANAIADLVEDASPQLGGELASNGNNIKFADSDKAVFGSGGDLKIYHNGTDNYIMPSNGKLIINNGSETLAQFTSNGAAELYYDNSKKLETSNAGVEITGKLFVDGLDMEDNEKILLGNSDDLEIYHSGSNSFISDVGTGDLIFTGTVIRPRTDQFTVTNAAANEVMINSVANGAVSLYYDAVKKFETTNDGIKVGSVTIDSGFNNIGLPDNGQLRLGAGEDLRIHHDGTDSRITNTTGYLYIDSPNIAIRSDGGQEDSIQALQNGSVSLFYNGTKKFETTSNGVTISGNPTINGNTNANGHVTLPDHTGSQDGKLRLGTGTDLNIYHDGTDSYFDNNTGVLRIYSDNIYLKDKDGGDMFIKCIHDGAVELYHNNSKRFETTSEGATVEGPSSAARLKFDTSGSHRGSIYFNNSNVGGFLSENGDWAVNFDRGANSFIYSHWMPSSDSYDLGSSTYKWGEVHAVNFYGNGSNLTGIDPTIADGCIYENNQTISSTVSTSSSKNSFAAGDINITGTLTVADNTTFVIL